MYDLDEHTRFSVEAYSEGFIYDLFVNTRHVRNVCKSTMLDMANAIVSLYTPLSMHTHAISGATTIEQSGDFTPDDGDCKEPGHDAGTHEKSRQSYVQPRVNSR